jgi:hypothetical protein
MFSIAPNELSLMNFSLWVFIAQRYGPDLPFGRFGCFPDRHIRTSLSGEIFYQATTIAAVSQKTCALVRMRFEN